jgi:hypothetical protein
MAATRASHSVQIGDVGVSLAAADAALAHGDTGSPWYTIPFGVRAHALRWSGATDEAEAAFAEGYMGESARRDQLLGVVSSHSSLALIHAEAGGWSVADRHARTALELTRHGLSEHWIMTEAHVALALLAAHRDDREAAPAAAAHAVVLSRRGGVAGSRANTLLTVAGLRLDDGAAEEAAELVAEAGAILQAAPDPGAMVLARL